MQNPYATPTAAVADHATADDDTYEPRIFSTSGRIGRLRYIAYSFLFSLLLAFPLGFVAGLLGAGRGAKAMPIAMMVIYIPLLATMLVVVKRRLNDLNQSGWLGLLMLVPLVNFFFGLYLLFWPGSKGSNDYGPAPSPNSLLLIVFGLVLPLAMIAVLAAVAIPAYQSYVARAQHMQAPVAPTP